MTSLGELISLVAQQSRICLQCKRFRRPEFDPWVGKTPWRKKWQPTPVFLLRKSHGQRSLVGYSPWGCKEFGHNWDWPPLSSAGFLISVIHDACMVSHVWLFVTRGLQPTRLLCSWDFPGKNTVVSSHFLLQRIFLTQRSNSHLLCLLYW